MTQDAVRSRARIDRAVSTLFGMTVAPVLGSLISATLVVTYGVMNSGSADGAISAVIGITIVGSIFALPIACLIGLPVHLIFVRARIAALAAYALAGTTIGAVTSVLPALMFSQLGSTSFFTITGVIAGTAGGALFWLIRRPDRDAPIPPQK